MLITKLLYFVFAPLGTAMFVMMSAALLLHKQRTKLAFKFMVLGTLWLLFWSLPVVSYPFRNYIESDFSYTPAEKYDLAGSIVLLGGGVDGPKQPGMMPDLRDASDRVWFAARLYKAGRAPFIVVSGGPTSGGNFMTEAESMREVLLDFGVPSSAIILEDRSRNTRENASYSIEVLRQRGVSKFFLVTSALHMQRSLKAFRAEGMTVVPAPCDFEGRTMFTAKDFIPTADALDGSGRAIKEWVGQKVF